MSRARPAPKSPRRPASAELLFEIGTEELPAPFVAPALRDLSEGAARLLKEARLAYASIRTLGTPRRLVLHVAGLADHQEAMVTAVMGPSKAVGYDAHRQPTKAAVGFAASQRVSLDALEVRATPKGEYLFAVKREPGRRAASLLPEILTQLLERLAFPKAMRWNASGVRFARPVRWLLCLYQGKALPVRWGGLSATDRTFGHRFLSSGKPLRVPDFRSYAKALDKAWVMVEPDRRRAWIETQLATIARKKGGLLHRDEGLLEQAVFAVEHPYAIAGAFRKDYLTLPKDVLVTVMKEQQGYFSLVTESGALLPVFIAVTNMAKSQETVVRAGNERVLAARLADARFFFDEDRRIRLEARVEKLRGVTFHQKLGSLHQKVERLMTLAPRLAYTLGDPGGGETCRQAAKLSKADLTSAMVGEFPTLQGIMGREYARHDGESDLVANAIGEHYLPRFADDVIPPSFPGKVLSLADRLDSLTAFFTVGLIPSGSEDPYALRRHATAVIRILLEGGLSLNLTVAVQETLALLKNQGIALEEKGAAELQRFFGERFRYYCREQLKLRDDVVEAVLANVGSVFDPLPLRARAEALQAFAARPEFESLVIACKRAENITKASREDHVDPTLLHEPVEKDLHAALVATEELIAALIEEAQFDEALDRLASLKRPIDAFFDGVMVMTEDEPIRKNRLALLVRIRNLFRRYADFSKIQVETR